MSTDEMDALLVTNLRQINIALNRIYYCVQPRVWDAFDAAAKDWLETTGWRGEIDFTDDNAWTAPPEWALADEDGSDPSYLAFFAFELERGNEDAAGEDQAWLVSACGEGRNSFGVRLRWDIGLGVRKPIWRKAAVGHPAIGDLVALGFRYEDDTGFLFMPVTFSSAALAQSIADGDFGLWNQPLLDALRILPRAAQALQPLLSQVRVSSA